jgi:hypothetical protein
MMKEGAEPEQDLVGQHVATISPMASARREEPQAREGQMGTLPMMPIAASCRRWDMNILPKDIERRKNTVFRYRCWAVDAAPTKA